MHLHLFSTPGENDIRNILEASKPYLDSRAEPSVAYLPAAAFGYNWLDYTEKAFEVLGSIELIDAEMIAPPQVEPIFDRAALAYISGGNTFLMNQRLHQSGIMPILRQKIAAGLPLVAFSAGTILCGPNILTSSDMNICETCFFSGLDLVPYNFSVHYPGDEQARLDFDEWLGEYHYFHANPILALEDGTYVRVRDGEIMVVSGSCWLLEKGSGRRKVEIGERLE